MKTHYIKRASERERERGGGVALSNHWLTVRKLIIVEYRRWWQKDGLCQSSFILCCNIRHFVLWQWICVCVYMTCLLSSSLKRFAFSDRRVSKFGIQILFFVPIHGAKSFIWHRVWATNCIELHVRYQNTVIEIFLPSKNSRFSLLLLLLYDAKLFGEKSLTKSLTMRFVRQEKKKPSQLCVC